MVEASEIGLKEDEIELDLGLSIGGSFGKSEKLKPVFLFDSGSNVFDADLRENQTSFSRSCTSPTPLEPADQSAPLDPQTKREIHALRRQEAKKKQREKRCRGRNSVSDNASEIQIEEQPACKRENGLCAVRPVPAGAVRALHGERVCLSLCCAVLGSRRQRENMFQPVACRGVRPSLGHQNLGLNVTNGCDSEQDGRKDGETKLTASNGSPMCSSSTISDHRSSSHGGGGSSDTRTHSSHSLPGQHHVNGSKANDIKVHYEQSACSHPNPNESVQIHENVYNDQKVVPAHVTQSSPAAGRREEAIQQATDPIPLEKPISTAGNSTPCPLRETKTDIGNLLNLSSRVRIPFLSFHKCPTYPRREMVPTEKPSMVSCTDIRNQSRLGFKSAIALAKPGPVAEQEVQSSKLTASPPGSSNPSKTLESAIAYEVREVAEHLTPFSLLSPHLLRSNLKLTQISVAVDAFVILMASVLIKNSVMAPAVQQTPAENLPPTPTADLVGNAFVHQYYLILHQSPELVHRFYQDTSKLGRPEENGVMSITSTMQAINEKILSLDYGKLSADITTVDAQDSHNGECLSLYVDEETHQTGNQVLVNDVDGPLTPKHDSSDVHENHVSEPVTAVSDDVDAVEVYNTETEGVLVEEEEAPVPEIVDEIPDDMQTVDEYNTKTEAVPKKSYASIVKVMKENAVPFSAPTPSPAKSAAQKNQEQHVRAAPAPAPAPAPTPTLVSETLASSTNVNENGHMQEAEDGYSIYIKGLPANSTIALIENEFQKFGPIKSGGIQVRHQKGFCYGFVEFEVASAVQSAIEASPVMVGGRPTIVEEKRSTNAGNSRGRFPSVRGNGYRNEGTRGRGNYGGGRGYGRGGDYNSRSEFGNRNNNRGGMPNRGGDGYQRAENGSRVNRAGGLGVNSAAKPTVPRVSASA
ncbi:hypothetical protein FNV43_RR23034 [Rhamnella rubrinervis]|uniref:RRM domain-containing protein n=1 Tax=Rhamnella rubrinervis TaxID=2594499 RepID=A0A8K0GNR9_9ROSA|nr:hypothetical protein FNV43_RR23034 [Rhamnella rubrinervis]